MKQSTLPNETQEELLLQIRTAHRLLAAYYQRLLPSIEQIANELEVEYYFWKPNKFNRPTSRVSNPFAPWKWDMLPAMSTEYVFKNIKEERSISLGDYLISFDVDSDTGVKMKGKELDGLELPISIEEAESLIHVGIYTPYKNEDKHWYSNIWSEGAYPKYTDINEPFVCTKDPKESCPIISSGFKTSIAMLMTDEGIELLIKRIRSCLANVLELSGADGKQEFQPLPSC